MPVELRKRKEQATAPTTAPTAKKQGTLAKVVDKVKEAVTGESKTVAVGDIVELEGFGGEVETNDGAKTTLKQLVDESSGGVVLFTYPKASTPGCTTQVCLFRDSYDPLTATGYSIYGLSKDSPKANTTFKEKQKLPYPLLCDPNGTLISAIGLKKAPTGTTRGVFVIDKAGKVLAAEPGGPAATVEVVRKLVGTSEGGPVVASESTTETKAPAANGTAVGTEEDVETAETAAEVADTAEKLDAK